MKKLKAFFKKLGPGLITGASDDDPSGIATYSQAGAQFGYSQLWTALFTFPFMTVIQEMCGRIGLVTGKGLTRVFREQYARPVVYTVVVLLCVANTINIGANLGAMAMAGRMIIGWPFLVGLLVIMAVTLLLEIFVSYKVYARFLKYLTLSLFAYIAALFVVKQDWSQIITSTIIPYISFSETYLLNIVAIFGTTISPYLFFWQANEEVEEELMTHKLRVSGRDRPRISIRDIRQLRLDTTIGMLFSNVVMFCIIATVASTLGAQGFLTIETADQAAEALRPLAGDFGFILFALGILGTGLLAIPILAGSASYALSELYQWRSGLNRKFKQAKAFYAVIIIATLIGVLVNLTPIRPFQMLYYTAIFNGLCAPPLLVLIVLTSSNKKIMGKYCNSRLSASLGWITAGVMTVAAIALLWSFIF